MGKCYSCFFSEQNAFHDHFITGAHCHVPLLLIVPAGQKHIIEEFRRNSMKAAYPLIGGLCKERKIFSPGEGTFETNHFDEAEK